MALSYQEEMGITRAFLDSMVLRLAGKDGDRLPEEGKLYHQVDPVSQCLLGTLAALPDPDYDGPQLPNSMGLVLLVEPDRDGRVDIRVSGQFDIAHRYIPDFDQMKAHLIQETYGLRHDQQIALCHKRFTVAFEDIRLSLRAGSHDWDRNEDYFAGWFKAWSDQLLADERIFRRCKTNERGNAMYWFLWNEEAITDQRSLNEAVHRNIFEDHKRILEYRVTLRGRLRPVPAGLLAEPNRHFLEVYLVNETAVRDAKAFGVEFPYLLDARMAVDIDSGTPFLMPHRLAPEEYRYQDGDGAPGYGVTCAVAQESASRFATRSLPVFAQPRIEAPTPEQVGMSAGPEYRCLAADPLPILTSFLESLEAYRDTWRSRKATLAAQGKPAEAEAARLDQVQFEAEVERVRDGIALLHTHPHLMQSFRWMNEAMAEAIVRQGKSFTRWHLFQIGFILTQIRAVHERHCPPSARQGAASVADILWFATGGGKTEAYLGIIAMGMFHARLYGRLYGVTAWMRFPLRMLSVQQFQRLAYVVAQANRIRQRELLPGHPFTIGYFTGGGTPSQISSGSDYYHGTFLPLMTEARLSAMKFIGDCPYCEARDSVRIVKDLARSRLKHVCANPDCWSNTEESSGHYGEGIRGEIGIYVSDEECYRYLPTVMVGTIDKLAVMAHNVRFSKFFGTASHFCPDHGFSGSGRCEHRSCRPSIGGGFESVPCENNSRTSRIRTAAVPPLPDPGFSFLITDEAHLLRENLGNFDGHYESVLEALQTAHGGQSPKVLMATATIKDFEQHVAHLYQKRAVRFPAPGATQGESFYARRVSDPETGQPLVRRWYVGLLPMGRGNAAMRAVAEISTRGLDQADEWRERLSRRDPALLGALGLAPDRAADVLAHLGKHLNTHLIYANRKRNITEILRFVEEANGQRNTIRTHFRLDGESTLEDILGAIRHIEAKGPDDPRRQVLATSVVSHGVDIAELNFMAMAGWPPSTAEYIQSSARSGRVHPGIVVSALSPFRLYETHVFLNFLDYHAFLDRLVESVPINRFAPNVLERTLPGLMSAVLLNWAPHQPWGRSLSTSVKTLHKVLNDTPDSAGEIGRIVKDALRVPSALEGAFDRRVQTEFAEDLARLVDQTLARLVDWSPNKMDQSITDALGDIFGYAPMRSFRDIEDQIQIKPADDDADKLIDALIP